jgi:hypothetical protein
VVVYPAPQISKSVSARPGCIVYPRSVLLFCVIRQCSFIPTGSAVAVERVFSGGRDTTGLRRASLKAETIEFLTFVKARLRVAREVSKKEREGEGEGI